MGIDTQGSKADPTATTAATAMATKEKEERTRNVPPPTRIFHDRSSRTTALHDHPTLPRSRPKSEPTCQSTARKYRCATQTAKMTAYSQRQMETMSRDIQFPFSKLSQQHVDSQLAMIRTHVAQPITASIAEPAWIEGGHVLVGNKYHAASLPQNQNRWNVSAVLNCASGGISRLPVDRMKEQGIRYQFTNVQQDNYSYPILFDPKTGNPSQHLIKAKSLYESIVLPSLNGSTSNDDTADEAMGMNIDNDDDNDNDDNDSNNNDSTTIAQDVSPNGRALFFCVAGQNRSATLAIAVMMLFGHSLQDMVISLSKSRPFVLENVGFQRQLVELEGILADPSSQKVRLSPASTMFAYGTSPDRLQEITASLSKPVPSVSLGSAAAAVAAAAMAAMTTVMTASSTTTSSTSSTAAEVSAGAAATIVSSTVPSDSPTSKARRPLLNQQLSSSELLRETGMVEVELLIPGLCTLEAQIPQVCSIQTVKKCLVEYANQDLLAYTEPTSLRVAKSWLVLAMFGYDDMYDFPLEDEVMERSVQLARIESMFGLRVQYPKKRSLAAFSASHRSISQQRLSSLYIQRQPSSGQMAQNESHHEPMVEWSSKCRFGLAVFSTYQQIPKAIETKHVGRTPSMASPEVMDTTNGAPAGTGANEQAEEDADLYDRIEQPWIFIHEERPGAPATFLENTLMSTHLRGWDFVTGQSYCSKQPIVFSFSPDPRDKRQFMRISTSANEPVQFHAPGEGGILGMGGNAIVHRVELKPILESTNRLDPMLEVMSTASNDGKCSDDGNDLDKINANGAVGSTTRTDGNGSYIPSESEAAGVAPMMVEQGAEKKFGSSPNRLSAMLATRAQMDGSGPIPPCWDAAVKRHFSLEKMIASLENQSEAGLAKRLRLANSLNSDGRVVEFYGLGIALAANAYKKGEYKFEATLLARYEEEFSTYTLRKFMEDYTFQLDRFDDGTPQEREKIEQLQADFSLIKVKVLLVNLLNGFRDLTLMGVQAFDFNHLNNVLISRDQRTVRLIDIDGDSKGSIQVDDEYMQGRPERSAPHKPSLDVDLNTVLPTMVQQLILGKGRGRSFVTNTVSEVWRASPEDGKRRIREVLKENFFSGDTMSKDAMFKIEKHTRKVSEWFYCMLKKHEPWNTWTRDIYDAMRCIDHLPIS